MTNYAKVGGILSIISGALGILMGVGFIAMSFLLMFLIQSDMGANEDVPSFIFWMYAAMGVIFILLSVLPVVGGIFALKRKHFGWALAGGICANLVFCLSGIPALIFISMGKSEFDVVEEGQAPQTPTAKYPTIVAIMNYIAGGSSILSGLYCVLVAVFFMGWMRDMAGYDAFSYDVINVMDTFYYIIGGVNIVFGLLAIVGGRMAQLRKSWGWVLAGAIIAVLAFYPCGIPAVIFAVLGKDEFKREPELLTA